MTPRTRAIIAVDYAGQPCDLDELQDLAHSTGGLLIEDACHALGATYRNRRVGQIADLTVFSLHPVKHITAGEGGVVTTDDPSLAARLRRFRTHGISVDHRTREREGAWHYEVLELGYNYRITDLQCALGLSQLAKLGGWLVRRREIVARYQKAFAGCAELELPVSLPDRESAWHLYVVRLNLDRLSADRATIFKALVAENIGVNVHYIPVPWHPYYAGLGYVRGGWPNAERAYERLLTLPLFPAMSDADADDVISAVQKVITYYRR
jgi:dTDP-4-amino-4,6-dideoxygalactose transaminase